ncbi:hypothetical protein Tco_1349395 [Tanacetum coccineum]
MGKGKLDHLLLHLVNGAAVKTTERVDPSFSVWMENFWQEGLQQKMNVASRREWDHLVLSQIVKHSFTQEDDKEINGKSRVVDLQTLTQWGKKEAGSSPPLSEENYVESGTPDLESGWKTSGQENDKEMNVQPECLILQTLTNMEKRKLGSSPHSSVTRQLWKT